MMLALVNACHTTASCTGQVQPAVTLYELGAAASAFNCHSLRLASLSLPRRPSSPRISRLWLVFRFFSRLRLAARSLIHKHHRISSGICLPHARENSPRDGTSTVRVKGLSSLRGSTLEKIENQFKFQYNAIPIRVPGTGKFKVNGGLAHSSG